MAFMYVSSKFGARNAAFTFITIIEASESVIPYPDKPYKLSGRGNENTLIESSGQSRGKFVGDSWVKIYRQRLNRLSSVMRFMV